MLHSSAFSPGKEKTISIVFSFSPVFLIPFFTFVSSDGTHPGFSKLFFKMEYIFLMRSDWFFPMSQITGLLIHPRVKLAATVSSWSTFGSNPFCFSFFYFSQLDISSSLTNNFSCILGLLWNLIPAFQVIGLSTIFTTSSCFLHQSDRSYVSLLRLVLV